MFLVTDKNEGYVEGSYCHNTLGLRPLHTSSLGLRPCSMLNAVYSSSPYFFAGTSLFPPFQSHAGKGKGKGGCLKRTTTGRADSPTFTVRFMIDGGSNANFTYDERLLRCAHFVAAKGSIGGISGGLSYTGVVHCTTILATHPTTLALLYTPVGSKNILSESVLLAEYGVEAIKPSAHDSHLRMPNSSIIPLVYEGGLWFVDLQFSTMSPRDGSPSPSLTSRSSMLQGLTTR